MITSKQDYEIQCRVKDWVENQLRFGSVGSHLPQHVVVEKLLSLEREVAELSVLCEKLDTELGKWVRGEIVEGYGAGDRRDGL